MSDYAKIYPQLTSEQKQYYAELSAGKRQVNVFNAIVQQMADVNKAIEQSRIVLEVQLTKMKYIARALRAYRTNLRTNFNLYQRR